jgi:hypothetical protein
MAFAKNVVEIPFLNFLIFELYSQVCDGLVFLLGLSSQILLLLHQRFYHLVLHIFLLRILIKSLQEVARLCLLLQLSWVG